MEIRAKLCKPQQHVVRPSCRRMILHIKGNKELRPHCLDDGDGRTSAVRDPGTAHRDVLLVV